MFFLAPVGRWQNPQAYFLAGDMKRFYKAKRTMLVATLMRQLEGRRI